MQVGIAQYIRFRTVEGTYIPTRNYQNFFVEEYRSLNGVLYQFAPFRLSGTISTKGGDNIQAALTTIPNDLTVALCTEAVLSYWIVEISTVVVNATSAPGSTTSPIGTTSGQFTEAGILATEVWNCSNMTQDYEKISITLSNPLDAARKHVPKRVLSESLVGSIPPTGAIFSS